MSAAHILEDLDSSKLQQDLSSSQRPVQLACSDKMVLVAAFFAKKYVQLGSSRFFLVTHIIYEYPLSKENGCAPTSGALQQ
jgi:hypothetical protein